MGHVLDGRDGRCCVALPRAAVAGETPTASAVCAGEVRRPRIRVLICDDSPEMREALTAAICGWEGFEVIGQAGDAAAALYLLATLRPDVIVLDVRMPGSAVRVARAAKGLPAAPRVVIHTTEVGSAVRRSFATTADEYVVKTGRLRPLRQALSRAAHGNTLPQAS